MRDEFNNHALSNPNIFSFYKQNNNKDEKKQTIGQLGLTERSRYIHSALVRFLKLCYFFVGPTLGQLWNTKSIFWSVHFLYKSTCFDTPS